MVIFDLVFGFLMLFAGRNFFWLCVAIVGFLIGVQYAPSFGYSDHWMVLLIAFALGCLGGVLAVCFEWLAIVFGVGFLGGGYLLINAFPSSTQHDPYSSLIFLVGGIVGMCLMIIIFDWTLIIISSLLGASLIVNAFQGTEAFHGILFIGCLATGIIVQYGMLRGSTQLEHSSKEA